MSAQPESIRPENTPLESTENPTAETDASASPWSLTLASDGEVLTARADTERLQVIMIGFPRGRNARQVKAKLADVMRVARGAARKYQAPKQLPSTLHFLLKGLLGWQSEIERKKRARPVSWLVLFAQGPDAAFAQVGGSEARVAMNGQEVGPPWTVVHGPDNRKAQAFMMYATQPIGLEVRWSVEGAGEEGETVEAVASWPGFQAPPAEAHLAVVESDGDSGEAKADESATAAAAVEIDVSQTDPPKTPVEVEIATAAADVAEPVAAEVAPIVEPASIVQPDETVDNVTSAGQPRLFEVVAPRGADAESSEVDRIEEVFAAMQPPPTDGDALSEAESIEAAGQEVVCDDVAPESPVSQAGEIETAVEVGADGGTVGTGEVDVEDSAHASPDAETHEQVEDETGALGDAPEESETKPRRAGLFGWLGSLFSGGDKADPSDLDSLEAAVDQGVEDWPAEAAHETGVASATKDDGVEVAYEADATTTETRGEEDTATAETGGEADESMETRVEASQTSDEAPVLQAPAVGESNESHLSDVLNDMMLGDESMVADAESYETEAIESVQADSEAWDTEAAVHLDAPGHPDPIEDMIVGDEDYANGPGEWAEDMAVGADPAATVEDDLPADVDDVAGPLSEAAVFEISGEALMDRVEPEVDTSDPPAASMEPGAPSVEPAVDAPVESDAMTGEDLHPFWQMEIGQSTAAEAAVSGTSEASEPEPESKPETQPAEMAWEQLRDELADITAAGAVGGEIVPDAVPPERDESEFVEVTPVEVVPTEPQAHTPESVEPPPAESQHVEPEYASHESQDALDTAPEIMMDVEERPGIDLPQMADRPAIDVIGEDEETARLETDVVAQSVAIDADPGSDTAATDASAPDAVSATPADAAHPEAVADQPAAPSETIIEVAESIEPVDASVASQAVPATTTEAPINAMGALAALATQPEAAHRAPPPPLRPEWPVLEEKRDGSKRRSRLTLVGIISVLFVSGWMIGTMQGKGDDPAGPRAVVQRALSAVGLGTAEYTAKIASEPEGAWITVDGKDLPERTPADIRLDPGPHVITLSLPGHGGADFEVEGGRGETVALDAGLHGTVAIRSSGRVPIEVSIDGKDVGLAPITIEDLAPGTHDLAFKGPGLQPWAQTVEVRVNEISEVLARPFESPETGLIAVRASLGDDDEGSDLEGASVWIDGKLEGKTPIELELPRGPHSVRVVHGSASAPIQVIDLPGGNQRFAVFRLGSTQTLPRLTLLSQPSSFIPGKPAVVSAVVERVNAAEVLEMWVHAQMPEGAWRRYPMARLETPDGVVGTAALPPSVMEGRKTARHYVSAITRTGDELYTEIQVVKRKR